MDRFEIDQALITFEELVKSLGRDTVEAFIHAGKEVREQGLHGNIFEDPEGEFNLNASDAGLSFEFRGWGPFILPFERVEKILTSVN